jgi:predicted transport protein
VKIYEALEAYAQSLGDVEVVTRDRYALFRTKRIFADLVMMKDAVRLAIHLRRNVSDPMFFKTVEDRGKFTHVVKLQQMKSIAALKPLLKEAYNVSLGTSQNG